MATVGVDFDLAFEDVSTTVKTNAAAEAKTIDVTTSTGMVAEDAVAITLDSGDVHWDIIDSVTDGDTIVITTGIPSAASIGNAVKTYQAFMCRQFGQTKDFLVTDAPLLPQTLITESASPTNIQPEREIQISQVDWRKGFQDFMLEDEYMYYESENCDARLKGEVILASKKLAAISFGTQPAAVVITDAGLESWTGNTPNNWTETGTGVAEEHGIVVAPHSGSHCAVFGESANGTIYQELSSYDANYKGKTYIFSVYLHPHSSPTTKKLIVDDGDTTSEASATGNDAWEKVSVKHTVSSDATKLQLTVQCVSSAGDWLAVDDFACEAEPSFGAITELIEFGDQIVGAMGNCLFQVNGSITFPYSFPEDITALCVFENRLYIAQGWSDEYFYTSDLITFTECTLENSTAKYFANIGGATFVISDSNSTLRSSDNPINGGTAFSSEYQVGSDDWDITGLIDHLDIWFVRKEDDVYYLSGSDVFSLMNLKSEASTTYTYGLYSWGDCLYIPSGVNSLYEYDVGREIATTISPVRYAAGDANYDEEVLAICHDESYLYCVIDNGSDLKILSGRWETVNGDTDWYWHPLYDKTMNDITAMIISANSGSKRMYVGTDTYTDGIIPFFVPVAYSQPYTESGYECEASGTFYTPWYRSNFPTEEKYWKAIDITSICCTDKTSIIPYYQVKGGEWTPLTALTTNAYDGGYPDETTDSRDIGVSSERIRFKFVMAAANDDYTPILSGTRGGIVVYSILQADRKRQIVATLDIAPYFRERGLTRVSRTVSTDLTNLRALYTGNQSETVIGPDDTEYSVVFSREGYDEQLAYDSTLHWEHWWVTVKLLEV